MLVMHSTTVLIVEDEELLGLQLEKRLASFGIPSIVRFSNGEQAINHVKTHPVDIILMDVQIEGDLDGIETSYEIKRIKNIPIIFLSAHTEDEFLKRVAAIDPLGYLLKPLQEESLRVMISLAVHKSKLSRELEKKERWLEAILNNLTEAVIGIDLNFRIIFINPVAQSIIQKESSEALKNPLSQFLTFYDEDNRPFTENPIEKALQRGTPQCANNVMIKTSKNTRKIVNYSMSILLDEDKIKTGAVLCIREGS